MQRTLIVARLGAEHTGPVARIFAESDATELPRLIGVTRRTLYTFHDLYFHLIEADGDIAGTLGGFRGHPLFRDISDRLASYVRPYDPSWREPGDAIARPFYTWQAS